MAELKEKGPKLRFRFEGTRQKQLRMRGVDGMCFAGQRNAFDFDVAAVRIKPDIPGIVTKGISARKQIKALSSIFAHPLRGAPIIGIGSFPSDLRAKMLAVNIMSLSMGAQENSAQSRRLRQKDYPLWHKVYGGFKDTIRDNGLPDNPSMLIISNVDVDSTAPKVEKVRDLLEMFPSIPRVVVVSGVDPMTFFATRLHLPMDYGFYMGADNRENNTNILDM